MCVGVARVCVSGVYACVGVVCLRVSGVCVLHVCMWVVSVLPLCVLSLHVMCEWCLT